MKYDGLFVAIWTKNGKVYEVDMTDNEKGFILSAIQQIQGSKIIKLINPALPIIIDIKKLKKRKKK